MTNTITPAPAAPVSAGLPGRRTLTRSLLIAAVVIAPALTVQVLNLHPNPIAALVLYGAAVVAASFLLAWAAEAAQIDISSGLAIAVLAVIAVLPEYAVDLYYAYTSGHNPAFVQYAAANMTGSNRMLMGLGWPVVVLISIAVARKTGNKPVNALVLQPTALAANRKHLAPTLTARLTWPALVHAGHPHRGHPTGAPSTAKK